MRKSVSATTLACLLAMAGVLRAQEAPEAEEKAKAGDLTLSAGTDVVTSYVFRGYEYQDKGYIVQPFAQIGIVAYASDDLTITPYVGDWNSIHEFGEPGDGHWFETDVYAGADFAYKDFTLGAIYTLYNAPDNAFDDIQEAGLKLSYDDTALAEKSGLPLTLNPYAAWYIETDDKADTEDQYVELGLTPTVKFGESPWSVTFPLAIGLSPDHYFIDDEGHNERFGFASAGAFLTYTMPVSYGTWSIYGGATYYYLHADSVQKYDLAGGDNGEDRDYEIVGKIGMLFEH